MNQDQDFLLFEIGSNFQLEKHITDEQIMESFENIEMVKNIPELHIDSCTSITREGYATMLTHRNLNLRSLSVTNCDIMNDGALLATSKQENLEKLKLCSLKFVSSNGLIEYFNKANLNDLKVLSFKNFYSTLR